MNKKQEIKNKKYGSLLQSSLWASVQQAAGRSVFTLGENDQHLIIKHSLPFGRCWFYSPRLDVSAADFPALVNAAAALARKEKAIFWKVELLNSWVRASSPHPETRTERLTQHLIKNSHPLQYPETFLLDLNTNSDQLLAAMKPKTRYNIKLAEKHGVTVNWSTDVEVFYDLLTQTASRQKIGLHSKKHYEDIIKILGAADAAAIIIAYYKNEPIAANLVTFYGDTATYLHGGTNDAHKAVMAPYLLQWESMLEAQRRGLRWYDLGGCAVTTGKIDHWSGITRFKAGFGGDLHQFGETFDVVFDKTWYKLYTFYKR